jgi:uncharacterized protein DUF3185
MNAQRIVAVVLLVVGAILLIAGLNASHSVADQVSSTFTGRLTQETASYIVVGGAAAVLGSLMMVFTIGGERA